MTIAKPRQEILNPLKPLPGLLNRVILFGAGAGLLAWGLSLTANRVTSVVATKAFVNGKIITITAPLNGQVQANKTLDSGMSVTTKQLLLKVNEPLSNSQLLENLKFELVADKAKLEFLEGKIKEVSTDSTQQTLEREKYKAQQVALSQTEREPIQTSTEIGLAQQNIKQAELELRVAQGHEQVAKSKYEKYNFLFSQGAMSAFSVQEVLNNWKVSQEQVQAAKLKIETAKISLVEQQKSIKRLGANSASVDVKTVYANPELTELKRQRTELQVSIQAKEKTISQAEKSPIVQKSSPILASSSGSLWEVMVQDGEQVRAGQPLLKQLNCQQLWIDAFVNIDSLKRIQIGSPAQIEIYSSNLKLNGKVKTIRSPLSTEQKLGQDVAVNPPDLQNQQMAQVKIELQNPQELINNKQSSAQFCQVGQVAKVNIGQENSLLASLPFR